MTYASAVPGSLSVDHNGGASYQVEIAVPPGIAGVAPKLALTYSSLGGNGPLGFGWALSGLSAIERSGATLAQDGFISGVAFADEDRLTLDQARLVPRSGTTYFGRDTVYETEIQSWHRVRPIYQDTPPRRHGPDAFEVDQPDGRCFRYGSTQNALGVVAQDNPSVHTWYLSSIVDRRGNTIRFSYIEGGSGGRRLPARIDYTENGDVAARRSVRFKYEERSDPESRFIAGYEQSLDQRLHSISTYVDESPVSTYTLAYEYGAATGRSRLLSITRSDGSGSAAVPTTFAWQDAVPNFQAASVPDIAAGEWGAVFLPMDLDGDGRVDFVNASPVNGELQLTIVMAQSDGSFSKPIAVPRVPGLRFHGNPLLPMDADGDGKAELLYAAHKDDGMLGLTLFKAVQRDGAWTLEPGPIHGAGPADRPYGGRLLAADVDGDGMADLIYGYHADNGRLALATFFSSGSTSSGITFAPAPGVPDTTAATAEYGGELIALDANGDGMADVLYASPGDDGKLVLTVFRSSGRSGFQEVDDVLADAPPDGGRIVPMDVNGDGNTDLVYATRADDGKLALRLLVNDGRRFRAGAPFSTGQSFGGVLLPVALTGAGVPELLSVARGPHGVLALSVFRISSQGISELPGITQPPPGTRWGGNPMPLDLRGIGHSDFVYTFSAEGMQRALVMPAAGPHPDLLVGVANGVGQEHKLDYAPLTDPQVYTPDADEGHGRGMEPRALLHSAISGAGYKVGDIKDGSVSVGAAHVLQRTPIPRYVVRQHVRSDGAGGNRTRTYRYRSALIDHSGRGWLGFARVDFDDSVTGATATASLHQEFPLTQLEREKTTTRSSDGALMSRTSLTWETPKTGTSYQTRLTDTTKQTFTFAKPDSEPDTTVTRHIAAYDAFGHETQIDLSGNGLAAPSTVVQEHRNDEASWHLGELVEHAVYADSSKTVLLRRNWFEYDDDTGLAKKHDRWNDVAGQRLTSKASYDRFGNVLTVTDSAGAVHETDYETEFHTFPKTTRSFPATGTVLTEGFDYEPNFGTMVGATDANGVKESWQIDGLGRVIGETRAAPDGSTVQTSGETWSLENGSVCCTRSVRTSWTGETWATRRDTMDGCGRVIRTVRDATADGRRIVTQTTYDGHGARLSETLPCFEGDTPLSRSWTYDAYGRVVSTTVPAADGTQVVTTKTYPRTDTEMTVVAYGTPRARQTTVRYAAVGDDHLPVSRTDAAAATTTYSYDGLGRLLALTDPTGIATSATYDTLGRQTSVSIGRDAEVFVRRTISYDDPNRQATETGAEGSMTLTFDGHQRVVEKRTSAGATTQTTLLHYDESDASHGQGRLTGVVLPSGDVLRYGYDPDGNTTSRTVTLDGRACIIGHSFDPGRRSLSTTFPDGSVQTNTYAATGALTGVDFAATGKSVDQLFRFSDFDAYDKPRKKVWGNGLQTATAHDTHGRVKSRVTTGPAGTLFSETVKRDETDAVIEYGDPDAPNKLQYDAVGRLHQSDGAAGRATFEYDHAGNCVLADGTTISEHAGYAPLKGQGTDPFTATYNRDGSLAALDRDGSTTAYAYDAEQRLTSVGKTTLRYDHAGTRLVKAEDGCTTYYFGPEYEVVRFADGSVQRSCIIGVNGVRHCVRTAIDQGTPPVRDGVPAPGGAWFINDHRESVRVVVNDDGTQAATVQYTPFGRVAAATGIKSFRYGFSGREFDTDAKAYYFGARYYDPRLCRFITADDQLGGALLDRDAFNAYAYVLNDPASLVDPTGHAWWEFAVHLLVDVALVAAGIAATVATGGAAYAIGGSTLIGAGISGASYDIGEAAKGQGDHVTWAGWGIQLGIGAATGLVTGGVSAGATAVLKAGETATEEAVINASVMRPLTEAQQLASEANIKFALTSTANVAKMGAVMGITGAATGVGGTVANNALAGRNLTQGIAFAGFAGFFSGFAGAAISQSVPGGLSGLRGGALRGLIMGIQTGTREATVGSAPPPYETDLTHQPAAGAPHGSASPAPPVAASRRGFSGEARLHPQRWDTAGASRQVGGVAWAPVHNIAPRLLFGSLRPLVHAAPARKR